MRLQDRPRFRASAAVRFPGADGFARGAEAVRLLAQSGLHPSNCRLLDALEAANSGAGRRRRRPADRLRVGRPRARRLDRARARDRGRRGRRRAGRRREDDARGGEGARDGAAGAWRDAFVNAPYLRDVLARAGVVSETFETAITWDRFADVPRRRDARRRATRCERVCGGGTWSVASRTSIRTVPRRTTRCSRPARRGAELEQWDEIKARRERRADPPRRHHHAPPRRRPRSPPRVRPRAPAALRARAAARPSARSIRRGVLNPGVLLDPQPLR